MGVGLLGIAALHPAPDEEVVLLQQRVHGHHVLALPEHHTNLQNQSGEKASILLHKRHVRAELGRLTRLIRTLISPPQIYILSSSLSLSLSIYKYI